MCSHGDLPFLTATQSGHCRFDQGKCYGEERAQAAGRRAFIEGFAKAMNPTGRLPLVCAAP
jgi:hypothetical protein